MSVRRQRRYRAEEDTDINMVPIMNMFLVLIPFLLMSASFFHLKVINTSVPVLSDSSVGDAKEKEIKVTAILEIRKTGFYISATSDSLEAEALDKLNSVIVKKKDDAYPLDEMALCLQKIKEMYPKSDTLILIPEETVIYDTIILAMDAARKTDDNKLFPNVVLSGKVG